LLDFVNEAEVEMLKFFWCKWRKFCRWNVFAKLNLWVIFLLFVRNVCSKCFK